MNSSNEIRNIILLNIKRISNLESKLEQLSKNLEDKNQLLGLIRELIEEKNVENDIFKLNYLQDIFIHNNTNFKDFIIEDLEKNEDNEQLIPDNFFD